MNDTLITAALVLMNICMFGIIALWANYREEMKQEFKLIRRRIGQVKTRLADEERQDQADKRRTRYHARQGVKS